MLNAQRPTLKKSRKARPNLAFVVHFGHNSVGAEIALSLSLSACSLVILTLLCGVVAFTLLQQQHT
jgi:hypothetical protein